MNSTFAAEIASLHSSPFTFDTVVTQLIIVTRRGWLQTQETAKRSSREFSWLRANDGRKFSWLWANDGREFSLLRANDGREFSWLRANDGREFTGCGLTMAAN